MDAQYLAARKKQLVLLTLRSIVAGVLIFLIGLALNKGDVRNIFTVVAVLFVLPMARSLTELIMLFPHHSFSAEKKQKAGERAEGAGLILYDMVFTNKDRAMHLDLMGIFPGKVIGLIEKPAQADEKKLKKHQAEMKAAKEAIDTHLKNQAYRQKIVLYEDFGQFMKAIPDGQTHACDEEQLAELEAFRESIEYMII